VSMSLSPDAQGVPAELAAVLAQVEAALPVVNDPTAAIEAVRAGSYSGRDPDNLVTATIDGTGLITRIRFAGTVGMRDPAVVEAAVLAAVEAAKTQLAGAWAELDGSASPPRDPDDLAYERPEGDQ
jgi:DNA-binding protein YbaB